MKTRLGGKWWEIKFVRPASGSWGRCSYGRHTISLNRGMAGRKRREITLHEGLHAMFDFLSEDAVKAAARELEGLLHKVEAHDA